MDRELEFRGASAELIWNCRAPEILIEGPRGTTKTTAALWLGRMLCEYFPGTEGMIVRPFQREHAENIIPDWEENVLGMGHPAILASKAKRAQRESYDWPGIGSHLAMVGLDNAEKHLGGNKDFAIVDQAERCPEKQIAHIAGCLRRGNIKLSNGREWNPLVLVANPSYRNHYLIRDAKAGKTAWLKSVLRDNPRAFDAQGNILPWGLEYIARLKRRYHGAQLRKMLGGEWCSEDGLVYDVWDDEINILKQVYERERATSFLATADWAFSGTGGCEVWALERGRHDELLSITCVAEYYKSGQTLHWWSHKIVDLWEEFGFPRVIADSQDKAAIETVNDLLMRASGAKIGRMVTPTSKRRHSVPLGIDIVKQQIIAGRVFYSPNALREVDENLRDRGEPTCLPDEMNTLTWKERADGSLDMDTPDSPPKPDHAADQLRYLVTDPELWGAEMPREPFEMPKGPEQVRYEPAKLEGWRESAPHERVGMRMVIEEPDEPEWSDR